MGKILFIGVLDTNIRKANYQYKTRINLHDPNLLLMVLSDLEKIYNLPMKKVIDLYLSKDKTFPIG